MSNQPKNTEYALEMRQVSKRFPGTLAVDKVDFRVKRGEVHALMGENGAGKSTLMKMLNGLFNDYTGDIYINGEKKMLHTESGKRGRYWNGIPGAFPGAQNFYL